MVVRPDPASFWDGVWAWAESAGLLVAPDERGERPPVPHQVCDNCPICQTTALLDQVDPHVVVELTEVARGLITGLTSALASAAEQRMPTGGGNAPDSGPSGATGPRADLADEAEGGERADAEDPSDRQA